jgi:RNA polymerase sigma factor (sigma-70 family)
MSLFTVKPNDIDLVQGIRAGGSFRRSFENKLYHRYFYLIKEATFKHKIDEENASMAYSDTILTGIEHIANGRFEGRSELKTYLYQIFYNKCVDAIRRNTTKQNRSTSIDYLLEPIAETERSALANLIRQQDHEQLRKLITRLGERCQVLLRKWAEGFTDSELALEYAYNSAGVAQTTRLRCMEKLREMYKK